MGKLVDIMFSWNSMSWTMFADGVHRYGGQVRGFELTRFQLQNVDKEETAIV
jgi:hypothetical protein